MSTKTYAERLVAGLTALGWQKFASMSQKYVSFWKHGHGDRYLFVGKAGALRCGTCISNSHSVGDPTRQTEFYRRVLAAAPEPVEPPATERPHKLLADLLGTPTAPSAQPTSTP